MIKDLKKMIRKIFGKLCDIEIRNKTNYFSSEIKIKK